MDININRDSETQITASISGKISVENFRDLTNALDEVLQGDDPPQDVILNFDDVEQIDSVGLGALIKVHTATKKHGGALKIINANEFVKHSLNITKLDRIFSVS